jgi:hypothetical protein
MVHIRIQRLILDKLADFVLSNFDFDFWPKFSAFKTWKNFLVRQSLKETWFYADFDADYESKVYFDIKNHYYE